MVPVDSQGYVDGTGKWYSHTRQEVSALPGRPSTVGKARRWGEDEEASKVFDRAGPGQILGRIHHTVRPRKLVRRLDAMWEVACWGGPGDQTAWKFPVMETRRGTEVMQSPEDRMLDPSSEKLPEG